VPAVAGGRGVVEVTLVNASDQPTADEITLVPVPERRIVVTPPAQAYTIPPRGTQAVRFEVGLSAEALAGEYPVRAWTYVSRDLAVETRRSSRPPGRNAATLNLEIDHPLPRVAAVAGPEPLAATLAHVRPLAFRGGRQTSLGQVRLALSGSSLAVTAEVRDPHPRRDSLLTGSVEVFGAMPGSRRIWSVGLQPATGDAPARAVVEADGTLAPVADVRIASAPLPDGYRIDALVPLDRLGLDVSRARVLIEVRATIAPIPASGPKCRPRLGGDVTDRCRDQLATAAGDRPRVFSLAGPVATIPSPPRSSHAAIPIVWPRVRPSRRPPRRGRDRAAGPHARRPGGTPLHGA
jgi:hypothetical protein